MAVKHNSITSIIAETALKFAIFLTRFHLVHLASAKLQVVIRTMQIVIIYNRMAVNNLSVPQTTVQSVVKIVVSQMPSATVLLVYVSSAHVITGGEIVI
jgi:hypothetical protein